VETVKIRNNVSGYRLNIILNDILDLVSGSGDGDGIFGGSGTVPTSVVADITDKFTLDGAVDVGTSAPTTPIYENDFESGTLGDFVTSQTGDAASWSVEIGTGIGGGNAARSGDTGNNETTSITVTKNTVVEDSFLSFDYDLSTEDNFDGLQVYVNASLEFDVRTSTVGYVSVQLPISGIGPQIIEFRYRKDGGSAGGLDRVLIDNVLLVSKTIEFTAHKIASFKSNVEVDGETSSDTFVATGIGKTSTLENLDAKLVEGQRFTATLGDPNDPTNSVGMFHTASTDALAAGQEVRFFRGSHRPAGQRSEAHLTSTNSTAYYSGVDGLNYPMVELKLGGLRRMNLVGLNKTQGASYISSRLQIGVTEAPILANLDTLYINGNIASNESFDINTGSFKAKIVAPTVSQENTVTLPDGSGTLAFLSDIIDPSGLYLPLAGGTMTGDIIMGVNQISSSGNLSLKSDTSTLELISSLGNNVLHIDYSAVLSFQPQILTVRNQSGEIALTSDLTGDGIYDGSGVAPSYTEVTMTDAFTFSGANTFFGVGLAPEDTFSKLHVKGDGNGATNNLVLQNSDNTTLLTVLDNGNVGIGLGEPAERLHVDGNTRLDGSIAIGGGSPTVTSILNVTGLPTSSAGLVAGDVWNNAGVLTIV
jgi:hypothetical protein